MKRDRMIMGALLGLTTLQVLWNWLQADRKFTRLNLIVWLFFLGLLSAYYLMLRLENFAVAGKKVQHWVFSQITERRLVMISVLLLGLYSVWYVHHCWGKDVIGDDFSVFFHRYILLHQLFPSLIGYDPMLNGGYRTIQLLASGAVNLFLLTYPIATFFSLEAGFKSQAILVILLLPVLTYFSARLISFSHTESYLSAAFALVMTPIGHMGLGQMLFHGALPYVFSCELAVLVFALSYRVFFLERDATWGIPLIILLGSLACLHPVFFVIMGPVALATVLFGRTTVKRKVVYAALIAFGLLAINGSWVYQLMAFDGGELVGGHIDPAQLPLVDWLGKLEKNFFGFQVALVIGSLIGVGRLMRNTEEPEKRSLGRLLLFTLLYYALLSSIGWFVLAPLQPERFVVPLSFFLSLALGASWPTVKVFWTRIANGGTSISLVLNTALFLLTVFIALPYYVFIVGFPTASPTTVEVVEWLKENVKDSGRVFFDVPDRGAQDTPLDGQIPFYQVKSQQSLMGVPASNIFNKWRIVNWIREIGDCLKDPKLGALCSDLYNIHYIVTFPETGKRKRISLSEHDLSSNFKLVKTIDSIQFYKSTRSSSYFLTGRGEVKQSLNRITVTADPSEVVVLKFFWAPGLRTIPPLALEPYPLPNGLAFIKVQSNFHQRFDIIYR
jgi:hypothetical protein